MTRPGLKRGKMQISRLIAPLSGEQPQKVLSLLNEVFGESEMEMAKPSFSGEEDAYNRDILYTAHEGAELLGTVHLTIPRDMRIIGGLSGVCITPSARRRGICKALVECFLADFDKEGGEAVFLGTGNPVAAKLYASAGFSFLAGSFVMARVREDNYLDFTEKYFSGAAGQFKMVEGSPAFRYPLVPLVLYQGKGLIMDCNAELFSSMYIAQRSCAGLYPRYANIVKNGGFFAGAVSDGVLFAVASILPTPSGRRMDFFAHPSAEHILPDLIKFCEARGAEYALISDADEDKKSFLISQGYKKEERRMYSSGSISVNCMVMRK